MQIAPDTAAEDDAFRQIVATLHQRGDLAAAEQAYRRLLERQPDHVGALTNLGQVLRRRGQLEDALSCYRRAVTLPGAGAQQWFNLANAEDAGGDITAALDSLDKAVAIRPDLAIAQHKRGLVLGRLQRWPDAVLALRAALRADPDNPRLLTDLAIGLQATAACDLAEPVLRRALALQPNETAPLSRLCGLLLQTGRHEEAAPFIQSFMAATGAYNRSAVIWDMLADAIAAGPVPAPPVPGPGEEAGPAISVVVCSITPSKFKAVSDSLNRALQGCDHEIIGIHDARSLCEGYNRGLRQAGGDIVVFCHDDIAILNERLDRILGAALASQDIVGVAGTARLEGLIWWAGRPENLRGMVAHQSPGATTISCDIYGIEGAVAGGMQALDGVFLAARRTVAEALKFDEETFAGFHHYDLDFTYRAHLAGYRVAVCSEIRIIHASGGSWTDWERWARRFHEKFRHALPPLGPDALAPSPPPSDRWHAALLHTPEQVAAFQRAVIDPALVALVGGPPRPAPEGPERPPAPAPPRPGDDSRDGGAEANTESAVAPLTGFPIDPAALQAQLNGVLLERLPGDSRCIVQIGCADATLCGAIRRARPEALYVGIEANPEQAEAAQAAVSRMHVADGASADLVRLLGDVGPIDALILPDLLEQAPDAAAALGSLAALLAPQGRVVAVIRNVQHWTVLRSLLDANDDGIDGLGLRPLALVGALEIMAAAGLSVREIYSLVADEDRTADVVQALGAALRLFGVNPDDYASAAAPLRYVLTATRR